MRKITFTADKDMIEQVRHNGRSQEWTLNAAFHEWLLEFIQRAGGAQDSDILMKRFRRVRAGRRFTREEMNN